ncbi:hypothetical protein FAH67_03845 [Neisseria flavescens]|uniref:Uncharacterized protein n=1 Tax=Neisseria flavescens NRL30031/H210 TaxID=546264 RepID=C0ELR4_NEIFL|nr:hypothetical protein [Neisseria flavescens]SPY01444.1 Uncharacterised protein [Neisseria meningitidis]EEG34008.1 hypothetical protein NEIFLAOT_00876 [Neisseria flavescens NRL30031/H210]QCL68641.1 hypothetical protein FAH67_03845 [Neisseria flavescens]SPY06333.1 Uncharacterised protein [Neisseria meningitidis]STZ65387.1 Uncharacterised protein [Neisseria flavescens]
MANRYSNLQQGFTDTRGLEEYIRRNPKSFLEMLDSNPEFRLNVQQIARNWDDATIVRVSHLFEPNDYREPLSGRKMLVTPFAKMMSGYFSSAVAEMQYNPHFRMQPFSTYQNENKDVLKRFEEEYEKDKAKKQKAEKRMSEGVTKNNAETLKHVIEDTLKHASAEHKLQKVLTLLLLANEEFRENVHEYFSNKEQNADIDAEQDKIMLAMKLEIIASMPSEERQRFERDIQTARDNYEPFFALYPNLSEEQKQLFSITGATLQSAYQSPIGKQFIDSHLKEILSPEDYRKVKQAISKDPNADIGAVMYGIVGFDKTQELLERCAHVGRTHKNYKTNEASLTYATLMAMKPESVQQGYEAQRRLKGLPINYDVVHQPEQTLVNPSALETPQTSQTGTEEQNKVMPKSPSI